MMIESMNDHKMTGISRSRALMMALMIAGTVVAAPSFAADTSPAQADQSEADAKAQSQSSQTSGSYQLSPANRLLFDTNHLANVTPPTGLSYTFVRSGDSVNNYDDHVDLKVTNGRDNAKSVAMDFLSGDRHRFVPEVSHAEGNPAIMMFLQNDVIEMADRTGGNWRYFQRRIKTALEDSAKVETETADFNGKSVKTQRITIRPYARDQAHEDDMGGELNKRYIFTLSDAVPGQVLEIRSEVPGDENRSEPIVERLTLDSAKQIDSSSKPVAEKSSA